MKKFTLLLAVCAFTLIGCSKKEIAPSESTLKVGMVTDSGTIDDKSFNQGTWEGILEYQADNENVEIQYIQPSGESTQDYMNAIDNLVMAGNEVIVVAGFKFEEAIGQAQAIHPDINFVLIDGTPLVGSDYEVGDNVVSVFFTEHEAGFLTGVASALQSQTGKVGFIGGMKVPAVQKLGWGFVAGVAYANAIYGTDVEVIDYLYQGTFTDVDAGKAIAGAMYDKGADIIMQAAGGVGVGAINEAKSRAESGDSVYIVGVDIDQYSEGLISNGSSVILTSAMKNLGRASYEHVENHANNTFKGGETIVMDIKADGVGLPVENPNLTEDTITKVDEAMEQVKCGAVAVPSSLDDLNTFLDEYNYSVEGMNY